MLDVFKMNGYENGKTLFPFPYDWRKSNIVTADLLKQKIQEVKKICQCSRVNLVAHSMGGLVARQYVQSSDYRHDVDQLIFLATPHMGSPIAYDAWEGGILDFGAGLSKIFINVFARSQALTHGYLNTFDYIHKFPIASLQELLPVYSYLTDSNGLRLYPNNYPQNSFLENLDFNFQGWNSVRVTNFEANNGKGDTVVSFSVGSTSSPYWLHGISQTKFLGSGDGVVPKTSIDNFLLPDMLFSSDHTGIVSSSTPEVFKKLNNRDIVLSSGLRKVIHNILFVVLHSPIDMVIIAPDGKRLGKDFSTGTELAEIPDAFYSGFNTDDEYAVITDPLSGTYTVKTIGTGGGEYTIAANYIDAQGDVESSVAGTTTLGQVIQNTLTVDPSARSVLIKSSDKVPPVVTITAPLSKGLYAKTDTVFLTATVADQSPLATTTYWFGGKKVNPGSALPLSSLTTPSVQTVSVSATDVYGNTATSSLDFYVVKNTNSCLLDIVSILPLLKNKQPIDKPTLEQLIQDCTVLLKGKHRFDIR